LYKIKPAEHVKKLIRIQYQKPAEQVDRVKRTMKVTTNVDVGEKTFDYFLKMECDE